MKKISVLMVLMLLLVPVDTQAATSEIVANVSTTTQEEKNVSTAREVPHYNINLNGGTWDGTYYFLPNGELATECFFCDGIYTYYLQNDGTPMKSRLTYHPDGEHVIYFDEEGHESFDSVEHITMSISGEEVDDYCYFGTYGYMYVNEIAYMGNNATPSYFNAYGVMEKEGWFQFVDGNFGYADENGHLYHNRFGYNSFGQIVFYNWNGVVAKGKIEDDNFYYYMNETDGHLEKIERKTDVSSDVMPLSLPTNIENDHYDLSILGDNYFTQNVKDRNFINYMKDVKSPFEDWTMWIYPDISGNTINSENYKSGLYITNRGIMIGSKKSDVRSSYLARTLYEYDMIDGKAVYGRITSQYKDVENTYPEVAEILKKAVSYDEVNCCMNMTDRYPPAPTHMYDIDGIRFFYDSNDTVIMIEYFRYSTGNHYTFN